jgi:hypothetical protein
MLVRDALRGNGVRTLIMGCIRVSNPRYQYDTSEALGVGGGGQDWLGGWECEWRCEDEHMPMHVVCSSSVIRSHAQAQACMP